MLPGVKEICGGRRTARTRRERTSFEEHGLPNPVCASSLQLKEIDTTRQVRRGPLNSMRPVASESLAQCRHPSPCDVKNRQLDVRRLRQVEGDRCSGVERIWGILCKEYLLAGHFGGTQAIVAHTSVASAEMRLYLGRCKR
jgi:hypothetical protein